MVVGVGSKDAASNNPNHHFCRQFANVDIEKNNNAAELIGATSTSAKSIAPARRHEDQLFPHQDRFYQTTEIGKQFDIVDEQPKTTQSPNSALGSDQGAQRATTKDPSCTVTRSTSSSSEHNQHILNSHQQLHNKNNHHIKSYGDDTNNNNNNNHHHNQSSNAGGAATTGAAATPTPSVVPPSATNTHTKKKLSAAFRKQSVGFRVSCALVGCAFVVFVLTTVTLFWYFMGWQYGVQAIVVALLVVLGASGIWHWFGNWLYIAAVTLKRDAT